MNRAERNMNKSCCLAKTSRRQCDLFVCGEIICQADSHNATDGVNSNQMEEEEGEKKREMGKQRIEGISMIPYGLLSGVMTEERKGEPEINLTGRKLTETIQTEIRLTEISSEGFRIRLCRRQGQEKRIYPLYFNICFYQMDQAEYQEVRIHKFQIEAGEQTEFYQVYDIFTEQEDYIRAFQKLCMEYSRYIFLKLDGDDAVLSQQMTGYPAEKEAEHFSSWTEQKKEWFQNAAIYSDIQKLPAEFALELDHPGLYEQYLTRPVEAFMKEYWTEHGICDEAIRGIRPGRLYFGNQFCPHLFPEEEQIFELLEKAVAESMDVTISFSFIRENQLDQTSRLLRRLDQWSEKQRKKVEVVVNDWGMAELLKTETSHLNACLGLLLNKRKKDPRMGFKMGDRTLLDQNNLNAGFYQEYLEQELGITGYEWESCGYEQKIPEKSQAKKQNHLHLPFYQTNTSSYCTLCAVLEHGERGKQREQKACRMPCLEHRFFYPKHLHMTGKYNSLFACDTLLTERPGLLRKELGKKWDRLVVNLL